MRSPGSMRRSKPVEHQPLGAGIGERHFVEDEAVADRARRGQRVGLRNYLRSDAEKLHQVGQEQGLIGDARKSRENALDVVAGAGDSPSQELQRSPC